MLSISDIKDLFNQFFDRQSKVIGQATIETWITHRSANARMFGKTSAAYNALGQADKNKAKKAAVDRFTRRMNSIFQRRHDCIHNCDRPKSRSSPRETQRGVRRRCN